MESGSLFQKKPVRDLGFTAFLHFRRMEILGTRSHFCPQAGSPCDCLAKDRVDCAVSPKNSSVMTASVPREPRQEWS